MGNTPIRTIRLSDKNWKSLRYLAASMGYEDTTAFIRAIASGELEVKRPNEGRENDKNFDWGA
jgi:hypothetical protein